MPIFAMRGNFFFPNVRAKVEIAREISRNAFRFGIDHGRKIFLVSQIDPDRADVPAETDLYTVGVIAKITSIGSATAEKFEIMVSTLEAARITRFNASPDLLLADVETLDYYIVNKDDARALFDMTVGYIKQYAEVNTSAERIDPKTFTTPDGGVDYLAFTNVVGNELVTRLADRQSLLEENNLETRMEKICAYIIGELDIAAAEKRVANRVKKQIADGQKEYYLREQMKAISAELGEDANEKQEYLDRIKACGMPQDVAEKANKELSRLSRMSSTSPDAAVIRNYLDWLCDVPWTNETQDNADLALARKILDEDHYGLDKIKDRIVEYLAVMQLTHKLNGPILCFVGPPGVGKTSIVKSIARALGRKYLRVSLGGVRDEAEIRGHRRTYVGAIPGKIIYMMKQAGCINPVLLLDEIDKMGKDNRGDPASAMLEVLDPEQNNTFTDHFLEVPYDLSKVLFVCTANATDDIPEPLLDRMEVIELSGYTELEKIEIANKFLLKKNLALHGIPDGVITISDRTYAKIVERYTGESGVRSLERMIAAICRKVALKLVENPDAKVEVTPDNLHEFLGTEKRKDEQGVIPDTVGSARGLAWTRIGGVTLNVDATLFAGKGDVQLTGNLGDVMKESARTAISLVKSLADKYGIDKSRFETTDIHIHVPEGAVPKDGPSAGVTMATVVMSAFSDIPVSGQVAMTGEITLRGKVLPIGGLREKALAAYRIGIKKVIIPKGNEIDLDEIPDEVKKVVEFVPVETVDEVFDNALVK
ncbi:MAG TPA: endopeptidase La [Clostridiales bacterium]|nr:endopeptidase La [Clostridiales bacterium]